MDKAIRRPSPVRPGWIGPMEWGNLSTEERAEVAGLEPAEFSEWNVVRDRQQAKGLRRSQTGRPKSPQRPTGLADDSAQLLAPHCTTGWFDSLWGELWLLPDGLLRLGTGARGLSAAATMGATGITQPGSTRRITEEDVHDALAKRGRNRWIPRDQVSKAALRKGIIQGRLRVVLTDGTRIKLLWLNDETVHQALRSTLEDWVGDRLKLR
jgi:hypothetical protein